MTRSKIFQWCSVLFLALVAAFTWQLLEPVSRESDIAFYRDIRGDIELEAAVVNDPDIDAGSFVLFAARRFRKGGVDVPVGGIIGVRGIDPLSGVSDLLPGTRVQLEGRFFRPSFTDRTARSFARRHIFTFFDASRVNVLRRPFFLDPFFILSSFRRGLKHQLELLFDEPAAGISEGLLLGLRTEISDAVLLDFQTTGLTHILAISGYNITLLIQIVNGLLSGLSRRSRFAGACLLIGAFAVLTGLSASVLRASVMGIFTLMCEWMGRKSTGIHVLLVSGVILVAFDPNILLWDISFQLSFAATAGLLLLHPIMEPAFKKLPPFIGEPLGVTLAATFFTLPLTLFYFGRLSIISPVTNVLFLPLVPMIMLFSFFALCASFVPFLSLPFVAATWILTQLLVQGVSAFARIPFSQISLEGFSLPYLALTYGFLFLLIVRKSRSAQGFARCPSLSSSFPSRGRSERRTK